MRDEGAKVFEARAGLRLDWGGVDATVVAPPPEELFSDSNENSYGHPTHETLERLREYGAKVFRNDEDGDVIVTIKDQQVDVAVTNP